jgi:hypothetical protein
MPSTRDIRSYADGAIAQGKQAARESVAELSARAADAVNELLAQAEKAVNLDAIKAAIEPYVAQARGYSTTVTDRAEELYSSVKKDDRVAKFVNTAESVTGAVVETVQDRVVKPAQVLTGRGGKRAAKPSSRTTSAPAASARKATATKPAKTTARKTTTTASAAKKTSAKKATATKSTASKSTAAARKSTARKAPAKKATSP